MLRAAEVLLRGADANVQSALVAIGQEAPAAAAQAPTARPVELLVGLLGRDRRRISHDDVVGPLTRGRRGVDHFLALAARFFAALAIFFARAGFETLAVFAGLGAPSRRATYWCHGLANFARSLSPST